MVEVVAALIWDKDKFMICQRPAHKARALLWEFVGGKVEPGETKEQALIRECQEELAVTLSVGDVFMDVVHEYPDINVHLTLFNATIANGVPQKLEHNDIRWITPSEIPNHNFCPADKEILQKISEVQLKETNIDVNLSHLSQIPFDENDIPINYQWGGYCQDVSEFKKYNFLQLPGSSEDIYLCAEENGIALGEYLVDHILAEPFIYDIEGLLSPVCDYWFYQGWEKAEPYYSGLDLWVRQILELFVSAGLIVRVKSENSSYFAFSNLSTFERKTLPNDLIEKSRIICETALLQFCQKTFEDYGDTENLSSLATGDWASGIINQFIQTHT